jgi:hypothetical protein
VGERVRGRAGEGQRWVLRVLGHWSFLTGLRSSVSSLS